MIEELNSFSPADVQDLDRLMHELAETSCCDVRKLGEVAEDGNAHLYVVRQDSGLAHGLASGSGQELRGRIVGCACLCVAHTPERTLGFVEAVTVLSECRGQHLGRRLMEHLLAEAQRLGVQRLHLTSSPKRLAANEMYLSLGFKPKQTNCYVMDV